MERAVDAYVSALQCVADGFPFEFAAVRLARFRNDYPAAYKIGIHRKMLSKVRKPATKSWNRKKPWTKH